jgi:WD40 repeat protein
MVHSITKNIVHHITSTIIAPMSNIIVVGLKSGEIAVIDKGVIQKFHKSHNSSVISLVFSLDEKYLVSGALDGTIYKWNFRELKKIGEYDKHPNSVLSLCVSNDGSRLISSSTCIKIYDLTKNKVLHVIKQELAVCDLYNLFDSVILGRTSGHSIVTWHYLDVEFFYEGYSEWNRVCYGDAVINSMSYEKVQRHIIVGLQDGVILVLDHRFDVLQSITCRHFIPSIASFPSGFGVSFLGGVLGVWKHRGRNGYERLMTRTVMEQEHIIDHFTCNDSIWIYRSGSHLYIDAIPREVTAGLYRSLHEQSFCDIIVY